jgi:hypothetical protein
MECPLVETTQKISLLLRVFPKELTKCSANREGMVCIEQHSLICDKLEFKEPRLNLQYAQSLKGLDRISLVNHLRIYVLYFS